MKKLIMFGSLMVIVLAIGITPAIAIDLGNMNQARTKHAVYNEDVTIENINGQSHVDIATTNGSITVSGDIDGKEHSKTHSTKWFNNYWGQDRRRFKSYSLSEWGYHNQW